MSDVFDCLVVRSATAASLAHHAPRSTTDKADGHFDEYLPETPMAAVYRSFLPNRPALDVIP